MNDDIKTALAELARGCTTTTRRRLLTKNEDGGEEESKVIIETKEHPPSVAAAKLLFAESVPVQNRFLFMTVRELEEEKERLKKELFNETQNQN